MKIHEGLRDVTYLPVAPGIYWFYAIYDKFYLSNKSAPQYDAGVPADQGMNNSTITEATVPCRPPRGKCMSLQLFIFMVI